ncbi:hypothetical protein [Burkholderia gladioli]
MTNNTTAALTDEQRKALEHAIDWCHAMAFEDDERALRALLTSPRAAADAEHRFKNFHRLLCERFDYTHDEIDWKRDQVSLIEHIAKKIAAPRAAVPAPKGWKLVPVERSYNMRVKAMIAFNKAEKAGNDRDDALDAAHRAMLDAAPAAPVAEAVLKAPEGEDPMADGQRGADAGLKRLRAAYCVQQPAPVPDQMALVWRADVMNLALDYGRLAALVKAHIPHAYIAAPSALVPAKNCQTGYADICKVGARDGVACPSDSCDIDDGIRPDTAAQAVAADGAAGKLTQEVIDFCWNGYKTGQISADHTAKEVFTEVIQSLAAWVAKRAAVSPATAETSTGMPDEVRESLMDSQYLAGVTAGWNAANADDPNAALEKIHASRAGCLRPLRDWQKAGRPGVPATPATADERAAFVSLIGYERPETEGCAVDVWDSHRATWSAAIEFARASQAAAPATVHSTWRHLKTSGIYDILMHALYEADKETVAIVYRSRVDGQVWVRPGAEFYDGRFERVEQAAAPAEAREPDAYMTLDCVSLKPASVYLDREEIADMRPDHVVPLYRGPAPADAGEAVLPERKIGNPHHGGTQAYLATEHFNEGWNACLDAAQQAQSVKGGGQ